MPYYKYIIIYIYKTSRLNHENLTRINSEYDPAENGNPSESNKS